MLEDPRMKSPQLLCCGKERSWEDRQADTLPFLPLMLKRSLQKGSGIFPQSLYTWRSYKAVVTKPHPCLTPSISDLQRGGFPADICSTKHHLGKQDTQIPTSDAAGSQEQKGKQQGWHPQALGTRPTESARAAFLLPVMHM